MSILFESTIFAYFISVAVKAYAASLEGHLTFDLFGLAILLSEAFAEHPAHARIRRGWAEAARASRQAS